jgi:hypothetical protein
MNSYVEDKKGFIEAKFTERDVKILLEGLRMLWAAQREVANVEFSYTAELLSELERRWRF